MINSSTILTEIQGPTAHLWLNRPEVHNAFNLEMIGEFLLAIGSLNDNPEIRIIIIHGKGPSFCAGADLTWMRQASKLAPSENSIECIKLARCFYELRSSSKITIALVKGSAIGGAAGLIAASDLAFADTSAVFAFSEVRVGLIPAIIAPYIVRKTGLSKAGELMLTGRKFRAQVAEQIGLISQVFPVETFDQCTQQVVDDILRGAPMAQAAIKIQLNSPAIYNTDLEAINRNAKLLAEIRINSESKEGISAFLEKRNPSWYTDKSFEN